MPAGRLFNRAVNEIINFVFIFKINKRYWSTSYTKHNLYSLLREMPKSLNNSAGLKLKRQQFKEKSLKYTPGIINLQVLGSGASGAPRSLYIFTDQSRYLFNCGEGTQRLAHEHKMKLSKLEHIFFTYGSWENIGGLPGLSLTIQDVGVPEITVHGPEEIVDIFAATRRFIVLKNLHVKKSDCDENSFFEDTVMRVNYVPLRVTSERHYESKMSISLDRSEKRPVEDEHKINVVEDDSTSTDDETDYYAHERDKALQKIAKKNKRKSKRSASISFGEEGNSKRRCVLGETRNISMSYICKVHARPGALNLQACVDRGVPPGPLLGRLKSGEDITLADGTVVRSSDVTSPDDPGPVFIVIECPDERFLEPLEREVKYIPHQNTAKCLDDIAVLVVHFTPPHIMRNSRYKNWMAKFPETTSHLVINEDNDCMGSTAVHRLQQKLHLLNPEIFPLLHEYGIPVTTDENESQSSVVPLPNSHTQNGSINSVVAVSQNSYDYSDAGKSCSSHAVKDKSIYYGKTLTMFQLRPLKGICRLKELSLDLQEYKNEVFEIEGMSEALDNLHKQSKNESNCEKNLDYPSLVFLGTGSCIPNKTRNTSGILLNISADSCMLMDCGEGTYGQLVRFHGKDRIGSILSSLKAIYVSHLHADHHIGLIGILEARRKYLNGSKNTPPLFLLAPKQIMTWLKFYSNHFEPILDMIEIIPNSDLDYLNITTNDAVIRKVSNALGMSSVLTTPVRHCANSFGIALTHDAGWKITYSGDTMPCNALAELGRDSTILIHEATMEDDLAGEARFKMHSTTSEAIDMGKKMNAHFTMLTHFSQRYATLPRFNDNIKEGVGIAFDNMKVRLSDLPKLCRMYESLKLMFSEHQDELEQKAYRRQLKQLRMANNSPSSST